MVEQSRVPPSPILYILLERAAQGRLENPTEVHQSHSLRKLNTNDNSILFHALLPCSYNDYKMNNQSFLLDYEDWLDEGVHLMHIGACPHDPHADGGDQHRHAAHTMLDVGYV